jgi:DNA polymerase III epsilon subunit-like protein
MSYVAFDFETSGLPRVNSNTKVTLETLPNLDTCRAVSLSGACFSPSGRLLKTFDAIIRPDDFQIDESAIAIHGITQERALREGKPFVEVFRKFINFIGPTIKVLVAHNAIFDENVLRSEMMRHGLDTSQIQKFNVKCTLELNKRQSMCSMKLTTLYTKIFGETLENAHSSLADSIACGKIYHHFTSQNDTTAMRFAIKNHRFVFSSPSTTYDLKHVSKKRKTSLQDST